MNNTIRMIGLDLDGTLLNSRKELTPYTKRVLEDALSQGIVVLAATGRPLSGIPKEIRTFPGMRYAVTANGARVVDFLKEEVLIENLLSVETAGKVIEILKKHHGIHEFFVNGTGYMNEDGLCRVQEYFEDTEMPEYLLRTRVPVKNVKDSLKEMNKEVDKLQGIFCTQEDREGAMQALKEMEGIVVTAAMSNNLEINKAGTNKGRALIELGKLLGIRREEIMVCGDGGNDVEMLKEAGVSVAMGNGAEQVKRVADYVTVTNDEDGAAKAIAQFALK